MGLQLEEKRGRNMSKIKKILHKMNSSKSKVPLKDVALTDDTIDDIIGKTRNKMPKTGQGIICRNFGLGVIDSNGGSIAFSDGSAELMIPKGSISQPTLLYMRKSACFPQFDDVPIAVPIDCGPDGIQFNSAIVLKMKHNMKSLATDQLESSYYSQSGDEGWTKEGNCHISGDTCFMAVRHFTRFCPTVTRRSIEVSFDGTDEGGQNYIPHPCPHLKQLTILAGVRRYSSKEYLEINMYKIEMENFVQDYVEVSRELGSISCEVGLSTTFDAVYPGEDILIHPDALFQSGCKLHDHTAKLSTNGLLASNSAGIGSFELTRKAGHTDCAVLMHLSQGENTKKVLLKISFPAVGTSRPQEDICFETLGRVLPESVQIPPDLLDNDEYDWMSIAQENGYSDIISKKEVVDKGNFLLILLASEAKQKGKKEEEFIREKVKAVRMRTKQPNLQSLQDSAYSSGDHFGGSAYSENGQ